MDTLIAYSQRKLTQLKASQKRYLFGDIDWNQRLIVLLGHRGAGKTTLLLQAMKQDTVKSIYLTLDSLYFETKRFITTLEILYEAGYRNFYVDEVHRYAFWSADLKSAYDGFEDIKIIATGSSILEISKGQADLSRRAVVYHLAGLSFREYLNMIEVGDFSVLRLSDILQSHHQMTTDYSENYDILKHFQAYLKTGYYPFFNEGEAVYQLKLLEITNLIVEVDIMAYEDISYTTVRNLKKLLYLISQSVPFKPNITKLAGLLEVSRNTILKMFDLLARAQVIQLLKTEKGGVSFLQKPEKVYLQNTNLADVMAGGRANLGNMRETFFYNQLGVKHHVSASKWGDFLVDDTYTFEVGGPSKTQKQLAGVGNGYIAADGILGGIGNRIPLWLFGFLY